MTRWDKFVEYTLCAIAFISVGVLGATLAAGFIYLILAGIGAL